MQKGLLKVGDCERFGAQRGGSTCLEKEEVIFLFDILTLFMIT